MLSRVTTYLSFLEHARCPVRGFHNFLSYQRDWLDAEGTGDCQGQAVRALAEVLGSNLPDGYRALARELIDAVLPDAGRSAEPARASLRDSGLGTSAARRRAGHRTAGAGRLVGGAATGGMLPPLRAARLAVVRVADDLCQRRVAARPVRRRRALAGRRLSRRRRRHRSPFSTARRRADDVFWPIGNSGWYPHGEEKALYDQQPVEAVTMADAALGRVRPAATSESTWRPSAARTTGFTARTAWPSRSPTSNRRLLRRPAAVRRESEPGSGIDARLLVDGVAQPGTSSAGVADDPPAAAAAIAAIRRPVDVTPLGRNSMLIENRKHPNSVHRTVSVAIPTIRSSRPRTGPTRRTRCSTPARARWATKRSCWSASRIAAAIRT